MPGLYFLKLGGSLITDKQSAFTPRRDVLARLAREIASACAQDPDLRLILGHGSGSFGHVPAKKYATRQGVVTPEQWKGFAEVWKEARALNQIVMDSFVEAGLPVIAFPPSASATTQDGQVENWPLTPITSALQAGLIPVVNGDVVFDRNWGGTILSTEDLFFYLAHPLRPDRILLAGLEDGVWEDFPACTRRIDSITTANYATVLPYLKGSAGVDVTGGMVQKVTRMLELTRQIPHLEALIFSGQKPGLVQQALLGALPGTVIR
jgi:isopentenyl phosphate kinase